MTIIWASRLKTLLNASASLVKTRMHSVSVLRSKLAKLSRAAHSNLRSFRVTVHQKKQDVVIDTDEFPREGTTMEGLAKLKPAFKKGGTVTAGNASGINDGAAAFVVMSADKAKELGLKPMAKVVSYASAGVDPSIMGTGPVPSSRKALAKAGLEVKDLDLVEANEAFAAQAVYCCRELGFDMDKVNIHGGAIALGHPIGASGARILVTLLYGLKEVGGKYGLATLCIGGGQGTACVVENID